MLFCTAAMTILGSSFAVTKLILGYPMFTGQLLRYALAAVILSALVRPGNRPTLRQLGRLALLSATGLVGFNICVLSAVRAGDPPLVGTIVGAAPLALALVGPIAARRRPGIRLVLAAAVVVGGVALVEGGGHASAAGVAWAGGALVGEVLFSVLAAPLLERLGAVRVSAWACALAVPQLGVAVLVTGERWRMPSATEGAVLLYIAVVLTVGAFLLWYTGLRRLGVARGGMFTGLIPVATLAATAALDGRLPGLVPLIGTVVVGLGLVGGYAEGWWSRSAARTRSA